ncbi:MAG: hypothetical protein KQI35_08475 [Bacteroidetes bacterium]|nr:hypothetical protein [Bacteroidota bacterium]
MKKIIFLLITGLFWGFLTQAANLVNAGAAIKIASGTYLKINGDLRNEAGGTMDNSGNVIISGDWINNQPAFLDGTSGAVTFNGTSSQTIGGSASTNFSNININNDVVLNQNTYATSNLALSSAKLTLGSFHFWLLGGASITGAGPSAYVVANGSGFLIREVGPANVQFPVGTNSAYAPVVLNNIGTLDDLGVNLFADVLTGGLSGGTIPEINDCVNMSWQVAENVSGGSNLTLTTYWNAGLEGPNFDRTHAGIGHYFGGAWDPMEEVVASGSNPYFISRSGITELWTAFAVGDLESPMAVEVQLRIDLTVFLEGPYTGGGLMSTELNTGGYIPLGQPYNPALPYYDNASPVWQYAGSENVPSIPPGVVDWVVVQLRDSNTPANATSATVIGTQAAFVLDDGTVVALDGASTLSFNVNFSQNLYAVVFHRNHLGIISNTGLTQSAGIYSYDFSSGEFQAFGGANGHKQVEPGVWGMISSDGNGNGLIQNTDETAVWKVDLGSSGYSGGDFNMNGLTQNTDETNYWKVNLGAGGQTPAKANGVGYQSQVPD